MTAMSANELERCFDLSDIAEGSQFLHYPAGFSSFNAQMTELGHAVFSVDALYARPLAEIQAAADAAIAEGGCADTINAFLADFPAGLTEGRYVAGDHTTWQFKHHQFDCLLCSHWLFDEYPDSFFQSQVVLAILQVAREVRIFPLQNAAGEMPASLGPLMQQLQTLEVGEEVRAVDSPPSAGDNAMLRLWAKVCTV